MEMMIERIEDLEEEIASRAFLFDHPADYQEGVAAAMDAVRAFLVPARIAATA